MKKITCFKAYDVRGRVPEELDDDIAYRIGRAYAAFVKPRTVAVGRDIRGSSPGLTAALVKGLTDSGVDVLDIGVGGTELAYFATFSMKLDGGIMVTASHNPPNYNGMKFVREGSRPISADTGLQDIRSLAERDEFGPPVAARGKVRQVDVKPAYIEHLLSYVDRGSLAPLKIVVNAGNGGAGPIVDLLEPHLPFKFVKVFHEPDGSFPNGVPNPMIEANRDGHDRAAARRARRSGHSLGRRLRPLLLFRRARPIHRGLLHRRVARADVSRQTIRRRHRPRPAVDLEHARSHQQIRRQGRAEQIGARVHQATDA